MPFNRVQPAQNGQVFPWFIECEVDERKPANHTTKSGLIYEAGEAANTSVASNAEITSPHQGTCSTLSSAPHNNSTSGERYPSLTGSSANNAVAQVLFVSVGKDTHYNCGMSEFVLDHQSTDEVRS